MSTEEPTILVSTTNQLPEHSRPEGLNDARNLENKHPMTNMLGKSPSKQQTTDTNVQSRPNPLKVFSSRVSSSVRQQEIDVNKKDASSASISKSEKSNDATTESDKIVPLQPAGVASLAKDTFDYSNGGSKQEKKSQDGNATSPMSALEGKKDLEAQQKNSSSSSSRVASTTTTTTTTKSPQTTVSISSVLSEAKKNEASSSVQTEEEKGWIESYCFPFREINNNMNNNSSSAAAATPLFETVDIDDDIVIGVAGLPPQMADEMQRQDSWILFQEMRKAKEKEMNGSSSNVESDVITKTTKTKATTSAKKTSMSKKLSLIVNGDDVLPPSEPQQSKKNELKVKLSLKRPATAQSSEQPGNPKPSRGKKKKLTSSETVSPQFLPNEKMPSSSAASASLARKRTSVTKLDAEELDAHLRRIFNSIELIRRVLFPQCLSTAAPRPKPSPELAASWWNACNVALNQRNEPGALEILEEALLKFQQGAMNHFGLMVTVAGALAGEDRLTLGFDMFLPTGLSLAYILAYIKVLQATLVFLDRSLIQNRTELIRLIRKGVVELSNALRSPAGSTPNAVPRVLAHVKSSTVSYEDEVALLGLKGLESVQALIGWIDLFEKRFGKGSEHEKQCEIVLKLLQTLNDSSITSGGMVNLFSKVSSQIPDNAYRLSFQAITQRFLKLETEEIGSSSSSSAAISTTTTHTSTIAT